MGRLANEHRAHDGESSEQVDVSLAVLLELPAFANAHVVAGHRGLDRCVSSATIMEVADIEPWVKAHEIVLTTAYPLRDLPQGVGALVSSLDKAGVAALGVKLRGYLTALPDEMVIEADRLGFPLLLLDDHVSFDDLLTAVLTGVLHRPATAVELSEIVHRSLVSVLLEGGGLDQLVDALGRMMDGGSFVTSTDGRLLASAVPAGLLDRRDLFVESARFRSERFAPGTDRSGASGIAVASVMAGKVDHGRLVVVREDGPLLAADIAVLERAATVFALAISKSTAVQAVEAKYRGDFLRDVLLDRAGPPHGVVEHFESLGWNVTRPLVVVVAALDPTGEIGTGLPLDDPVDAETRMSQDRFTHAWVTVVEHADGTAPVVGFANEVVALVPVSPGNSPRVTVDALVDAVRGDGGGGRRSFATGVSRLVTEPAHIAAGYQQARRSVHVGRQLQRTSAVAHFDDLGAFRLLSLIEDTNELGNFVDEVLHELAHESDPEAADMRMTLRVLLDTNFNVAESSRRLHFHYNTMRYRITKLERLVGPFIDDPDLQLDLSLALRVMQMRGY